MGVCARFPVYFKHSKWVGIAITRGAAAALSFDMALVLLTVCRNVLTLLRESFVGEVLNASL